MVGLVLLDALYGDIEKFIAWITAQHQAAFLVSAYTNASRQWNLQLQAHLIGYDIAFSNSLPDKLKPTSVSFVETSGAIEQEDYLSQAWTKDPFRWVFQRMSPFHNYAHVSERLRSPAIWTSTQADAWGSTQELSSPALPR